MKVLKSHKCFGGHVRFWEHDSVSTGTKMKFSTFTPEEKVQGALIWLSGLSCTEENFITKAGAQKYLAAKGLMVICPDTSPRGLDLPYEHEAYDFGSGAGFYINATTEGYKDHYRMENYISQELYDLVKKEFQVDNISLSGHSMGGHGAITLGLKYPDKFQSLSAFSPIVNPIEVQWGQKAFRGYLGKENPESWKAHDSCELVKAGKFHKNPLLIDQGTADEFYEKQLKLENLEAACKGSKQEIIVRRQEGYDHSYYFIASFIQDHIEFHAQHLLRKM